MKKTFTFKPALIALLIIAAWIATIDAKGQTLNLIQNGGFESFSSCPLNISEMYKANNWYNIDISSSPYMPSTPDYLNRCFTNCIQGQQKCPTVPKNYVGYQDDPNGDGYAGVYTYLRDSSNHFFDNYREYFGQQLSDTLKHNKQYILKMYSSLANNSRWGTNGVGMYLSNNLIQINNNGLNHNWQVLNYTPQLLVTNPITDTLNWVTISNTMTANGGEKYITIGNYKSDAQISRTIVSSNMLEGYYGSYYYIDDVSITPINFADPDDTICSGSCKTISAYLGNFNISYHWTSNPTDPTLSGQENNSIITVCPTVSTTYTVTATDAVGGTSTDAVVITVANSPDSPIISGQWNTCHNVNSNIITSDTILNYNSNLVYNYTINHQLPPTSIASNIFTVNWNQHSNGGMLYVQATDPTNGCTSVDSLRVFDCCQNRPGDPIYKDTVFTSSPSEANFSFNGLIIINGNFTLNTKAIRLGPNTKIFINQGKTLRIKSTTMSACDTMWAGIYIPATAHLVDSSSYIYDAKNAIVSNDGGDFQIKNNAFLTNNYRNVVVNQYTGAGTHPGKISQTTINCNATLKPQYPPVAANRTYLGVEIFSVDKIFIGDTTAYSKRNTFDNMEYGILATKTNIAVYNNKFLNINAPSMVIDPPTPPYGTAVGIIGARNSSTNAIIGGANASGYVRSNYFNNCYYGIHFSSILNTIKAEYDTMVTQTYSLTFPRGIYAYAGSINSSTFRYNKVTNGAYGIQYVEMGENKIVNISSNFIEKATTGIAVTNAVLTLPYDFQVANNVINYPVSYSSTSTGIQVTNVDGIMTINNNRPYPFLSENRITFTVPNLNFTAYGIRVQNCYRAKIEQNSVKNTSATVATTDAQAIRFNGIHVELSPNTYLCKDTTIKMGCGLRFVGTMPGSAFKVNVMNATYYGIRLDGANVGNQGTAAQCYGNQWLGTQTYRLQGTWTPTYWYYYNTTSMTLSPLPTYVSLTPNPAPYVLQATGYLSTCSTITPQMLMGTVQDIVNEQYVYTTDVAENKYTDNVTAYSTLKSDPTLLTSSGQNNNKVQSFYNIHDAGNIGKFYKVNNNIHLGNINSAKAQNKVINPLNVMEINKQNVNDVYLNSWANDRFILTNDEYNILYNVATQDPILGGSAVYSARVMIGEFDAGSNLKTANSTNSSSTINMAGLIYPNPVTDDASIDYSIKTATSAELYVYSITGKQISKYELNTKENHFSFNTGQYNNGIYFYQLIANGEIISNNKFIIIK
jgi:hypothetical protein